MTGQQGDALLLRQLPQLRYQQAQQDQSDAAHSHDADVLPQHGGTQQGGAGGAQSAEQACTLGGGVALGHRLEGEAEAGADDGKAGDHQPLGTGLGQVGCLEHEGGHQRQQAQRTLRLAEAAIQRLGAQVNPKVVLSVFAAKLRTL